MSSQRKKGLDKKDFFPLAVSILVFLLALALIRLLFLRNLPDDFEWHRIKTTQSSASQQEIFQAENEYLPPESR